MCSPAFGQHRVQGSEVRMFAVLLADRAGDVLLLGARRPKRADRATSKRVQAGHARHGLGKAMAQPWNPQRNITILEMQPGSIGWFSLGAAHPQVLTDMRGASARMHSAPASKRVPATRSRRLAQAARALVQPHAQPALEVHTRKNNQEDIASRL